MTPLEQTIEKAQDAGRNCYIWGYNEDRNRALVVMDDNAYIAPLHACNGSLGRWECPKRNLAEYAELYRSRFPR